LGRRCAGTFPRSAHAFRHDPLGSPLTAWPCYRLRCARHPFGLPERTADSEGRLLWNPALEGAGGGLASTSHDLALWGHLLFGGEAMAGPYLDRLLDGVPVGPDAPGVLYGAGVAIYADTPRGPVYGHGGWVPAYVSSLRHYADHGVTVAFQINTDAGVMDDSSDLVPALEAALADLAIKALP
jgi:D-alanyl-D-alanine carboxypeptidase